jgi:hypothetical protein
MATFRAILYGVQAELATVIQALSPRAPKTEPPFRRRTSDAQMERDIRELTGPESARVFEFGGPIVIRNPYAGQQTAAYELDLALTVVLPRSQEWERQASDDMHQIAQAITNHDTTTTGCQLICIPSDAAWSRIDHTSDPTSYYTLPLRVVVEVV